MSPPGRRRGGPGGARARGGAAWPALQVLLLAAGAGARAEAWGGARGGGAPEAPARLHLVSHAPFPHDGLAAALVQDFGEALGLRGGAGLGEERRQATRRDGRGGPRDGQSLCNSLLGPRCRDLAADAVSTTALPVRDSVLEIGQEALLGLDRGKSGNAVVLFTHQQSIQGLRLTTALDPLQKLLGDKASVHFMDCRRNLEACVESGVRQVPEIVLYQAVEPDAPVPLTGRPPRSSLKTFYNEEWDLIQTEADARRVASEIAAFVEAYLRQDSYMPAYPSQDTQIQQAMTVVNRTKKDVRIFWMNYSNAEVLYFVLKPEQEVTTSSFASHVWNARSLDDRELIGQWSVRVQPAGRSHRIEVEPGMSKKSMDFRHELTLEELAAYMDGVDSEGSESDYTDADDGGDDDGNNNDGRDWDYGMERGEGEAPEGGVGGGGALEGEGGGEEAPEGEGGEVKALEEEGSGGEDYTFDFVGEVLDQAEGDVEIFGMFPEGPQFD